MVLNTSKKKGGIDASGSDNKKKKVKHLGCSRKKKFKQLGSSRKKEFKRLECGRVPLVDPLLYPKAAIAHYEKEHYGREKDIELQITKLQIAEDGKQYPHWEVVDLSTWVDHVEFNCFERAVPLKSGIWSHINFWAKPRVQCSTDIDTSAKRFFAELYKARSRDEIGVTHCCILEPDDPGITFGCGFCDHDDGFQHPAQGFSAGHWTNMRPFKARKSEDVPKVVVAEDVVSHF